MSTEGGVSGLLARSSTYGLQLASFFTLVFVQAGALLLFKLCQTSGSYTFSPASSVASTEFCKLVLACTLHAQHTAHRPHPCLSVWHLSVEPHQPPEVASCPPVSPCPPFS